MKKAIKTMLGLAAMLSVCAGLTACSEEVAPPQSPVREGLVDVVMSTSLPQVLETYAVDSKESGLTNLEGEGLMVRYIMEVYPKSSTEMVTRMITYKSLAEGETYRTASFNTRLVAAEYNFVFWADIVQKVTRMDYDAEMPEIDKTNGFYGNRYFCTNIAEDSDVLVYATATDTYANGSLLNVSTDVLGDGSLQSKNGEMNDAYTTVSAIDLRTAPANNPITLKRPFAKLRVIALDADVLKEQNLNLSDVVLTPSYGGIIPANYNALTGATSGSYSFNAKYKNNAIYSSEENENAKTIGVYYCLVPSSANDMTLSMGIKGSTQYTGITKDVPNVPLLANKLTTIKGNMFSKESTFEITIEDEFVLNSETVIETDKEAATVNDLKSSLTGKSETVTYTGKVSKADGFTLNFDEVTGPATYADEEAEVTYRYADGNAAELTLKFASLEEGAVLTFTGAHAPKVLRIVTNFKCSLRIDMKKCDVYYDGAAYKYIITTSGCKLWRSGVKYDALFQAGNAGGFFSGEGEDLEAHNFAINADFTLPEDAGCLSKIFHESESCNFVETIKTWLESNGGKTVWDFVGDPNI